MGNTNIKFKEQPPNSCPDAINPNHRIGPPGYLARAEWSDNMLKDHDQKQCPKCKLWVIWIPKE